MSNINTATVTRDDIKQADTKDLLEAYNEIIVKAGGQPIKKFTNRTTAESRIWKLIQSLPPEGAEKKAATPKKESKRANYEHSVIQVQVKENPKRVNSRAHKKFELLMECDGKTITEYKTKEGKYPTLDMEKGWPSTELRWAINLGLVKIAK